MGERELRGARLCRDSDWLWGTQEELMARIKSGGNGCRSDCRTDSRRDSRVEHMLGIAFIFVVPFVSCISGRGVSRIRVGSALCSCRCCRI
jgi:hypothetical protein